MRKRMKKLAAFFVALTMVMTMDVGAFATERSETAAAENTVDNVEKMENLETASADSMKIYAINIGSNMGDAVLIESDGKYLLMDIGYSDSSTGQTTGSYAYVKNFLNERGITSLSLYYSHFHGDHTGGVGNDGALDWLTTDFNVETVYAPDASVYEGKLDYSATYEKIERVTAQNNANTQITYLKKGDTFSFGDVKVEIIGPVGVSGYTEPGEAPEDGSVDGDGVYDDFVNNASLVARISCGNVVYLSAGDIKTEGENALIKEYGQNGKLEADIYKLSHHGIAPANSEAFLKCVTPTCSFGQNGGYQKQEEYGDNGKTRRMTYSSKMNASAYGLTYFVADESKTFEVDVTGDSIAMYRYSSASSKEKLTGIVKTVGSYGISYDGKNVVYDFYDYYYLDASGKPITGLQNVTIESVAGLRKFGSGGLLYAGEWGYNDANQFVYKPWLNVDGKWQYYDQKTAVIATGWKTIDGETYYFDKNGYRKTGIQTIDSDVYYFSSGGKLCKNTWYNDSKSGKDAAHWMYFGSDGKRITGWKKIDGEKYYFDKETGYRASGVTKIGSDYYWFSSGGKLQKSKWYNDSKSGKAADHWMYFDGDGKRVTGWKTVDKQKYYFDKKTGYRASGVTKIGSDYYWFTSGGKLQKNKWYNDSKSGKAEDHWMYFDKNGKRVTGWLTLKNEKYYLDKETGYRACGMTKIKSKYYYFSPGGKLQKSKTVKLDGYKCKIDKNGVWTNTPKVDGTKISSVKSSSKKTAKISWKKKSSVTGYEVYMSTSKNGKYEKITTIKKAKTTSYTKKKLKSNKTYYFKVRSYIEVDGNKFYSSYSSPKSVKVK